GLDESPVGRGPTVMDGNPMMVVPKVAATNHGCDQTVTAGLGELPEHRQPDPRGRVQFPAAFPADALRQLGSYELPERPAHVGEAKARPLRDLNRRLRARDDGRENFLPLPAREDEGEFVEHVRGSRVQCVPRGACARMHDAASRSLPFLKPPDRCTTAGPGGGATTSGAAGAPGARQARGS